MSSCKHLRIIRNSETKMKNKQGNQMTVYGAQKEIEERHTVISEMKANLHTALGRIDVNRNVLNFTEESEDNLDEKERKRVVERMTVKWLK